MLTVPQIDYADPRAVRLLLSRLIEPEDALLTALRGLAEPDGGPAELLRALLDERAPQPTWPDELVRRLNARRAGLRLRLSGADPGADLAAGAAVSARYVIPGDEDWPRMLDDLGPRAPFGVWIIGGFRTDVPALSVVGARACTGYGNQAAGQLAADLAKTGAVVISGAALGIDGAAHRGALAVDGTTVAVLACGIDRAYPVSHTALIDVIGARGAVLAELAPGTSPTRFRFLARNRLIAALGLGTVVVEAAMRSGSLLTARLAADLGRAVFAVPGPVTSRTSTGTNQLLCDGATPAVSGAQILEELGIARSGATTASARARAHAAARPRAAVPAVPSVAASHCTAATNSAAPNTSPPNSTASNSAAPGPAAPNSAPPNSAPPNSATQTTDAPGPVQQRIDFVLADGGSPGATLDSPDPRPSTLNLPNEPYALNAPISIDEPYALNEPNALNGPNVLSRPDSRDEPSPLDEPDPRAMLVREALPTRRSGRTAEVLSLARETGLTPLEVLATLGSLAGRGLAVKTGAGWALS